MVVNTRGAASELGLAMAMVVRNMTAAAGGGRGGVDQGLRSDTRLLCGRGERWWLTGLLACYSTRGYCSYGYCGGG